MSNYFDNRVSTQISPQTIQALRQDLKNFESKLPFLIGLTPAERRNMIKLRLDNRLFVEEAIQAMGEFPELLPDFLAQGEVEKDYSVFKDLDEMESHLLRMLNKIRDTRIRAGAEAYKGSLIFYGIIKLASSSGFRGTKEAFDRLRARFKFKKKKKTEAEGDAGIPQ